MFNFEDLANRREPVRTLAPLDLFETLDRQSTHYTLRPDQRQAVERLWQAKDQKDVVLKMATGAGKTLVALLHLHALGVSTREPVVYLCPTRQLVDQVIAEAQRAGVPAYAYPTDQPQPHPDCMSGRAVTVCTYSKLFNGHTTFNRFEVNITPRGIVLDDAHSGIDYIRSAFSLKITSLDVRLAELYAALRDRIGPVAATYNKPEWDEIENGDPRALIEVPYWSWRRVAREVEDLISPFGGTAPLMFPWEFVKDGIDRCRCLISSNTIEITPVLPLVERVRAYSYAKHRIFMSATLLDDTILARELDVSSDAVSAPVEVGSGTGERMIVAPSLMSPALSREWVIEWARALAAWKRVVVLCPSAKLAEDWTKAGAELGMGETAAVVAAKLRAGSTSFAVFVQRYDGVDLPDDACRVLIFDGLPTGESLVDRYDTATALMPGGARNRLVHRIEQGMGRAVRSPADYAVIVLAGRELGMFVSRGEIQGQFTEYTRLEIELAELMAREARSRQQSDPTTLLHDMVTKCLQRDAGWKALYDQRVRQALRNATNTVPPERVRRAAAERASVRHLWNGDAQRAVSSMDSAINEATNEEKGRLLQEQARAKSAYDPEGALSLQRAARDLSPRLLQPPAGVQRRTRSDSSMSAARTLLRWIHGERSSNAPVLLASSVCEWLTMSATHKQLEQAIAEMATFLGASGEQAERTHGEGAPDDLILWDSKALVIEAKQGDAPHIVKADAEQLLHSVQWFKSTFPGRDCVPVLVTKVTQTGQGVHLPDGARIITQQQLQMLVAAIQQLATQLSAKAPLEWTEQAVEQLLANSKLGPESFVGTFTVGPS